AVGSLKRDEGGLRRLMLSLGEAVVRGVTPDWSAVLPGDGRADLPTYPFQRQRFWPARGATDVTAAGMAATGHPLLGAALTLAADDGVVLTGRLASPTAPWLADHVLGGRPVLPGTAILDLVLAAGRQAAVPHIDDLTLREPLVLPATVQLAVGAGTAGTETRPVTVFARRDSDDEWVRHAEGTLRASPAVTGAADGDAVDLPADSEEVPLDGLADLFAEGGIEYGPAFRGLTRVWRSGDEVFAEASFDGDVTGLGVHPALLDAVLHSLAVTGGAPALPFDWQGVTLHATGARAVRARLTPVDGDAVTLAVTTPDGTPVLSAERLGFRPVDPAAPTAPLYRLEWTETAATEPAPADVVALSDAHAGLPTPLTVGCPAGTTPADVLPLLHDWADRGDGLLTLAVHPGPDGAATAGLVRSAAAEHPGRFAVVETRGAVLLPTADEPWTRVERGVLEAPRLARVTQAADAQADTASCAEMFPADGTVLITGGTGTLGAELARHLARRGVAALVLASRRGPDAPGAAELADELGELGARVEVVACDVADAAQVRALLAEHPVTAVVHTAGVLDDGVLSAVTPERLDAVVTPKLTAARVLDETTADLDLTAFVVFSAAAGLFGNAGQGAYAAANAGLDAVIARRRADGRPGTSLAWGLWSRASGMTGHLDETAVSRLARAGVRPLRTEEALALFDRAVGEDAADGPLVPIGLDLSTLRSRTDVPPLLRGLAGPRKAHVTSVDDIQADLAGATGAERQRRVLDLVRSHAAAVLGHPSSAAVEPGRAFKDLGFDSLTAVELRNRLAEATGTRLPATAVFDHPTPSALADVIAGTARSERSATTAVPADEPVAIVAMACRYPGGVADPEQLWDLVRSGTDAIGPFPTDRGWDIAGGYDPTGERPGSFSAREGGFLADMADFDAELFGISPREALAMDPQQRLLLETAWETFERAGLPAERLRGSRTGVFAGLMYSDYAGRLTGVPADVEGHLGTGNSGSVASGRLAYTFGLEGPAVTVDTACSSSLVALHLAARALRSGECDLALAGGVTAMSTPGLFTEFSRQRGLSPDGRCKAFADDADGTGFAEGAGLVLVQRLSDARRAGNRVLAVLRGSAVNSDGASNGLTAPNGPSQERVIRAALDSGGLRPSDVDAVEAHGTGTVLGDPIEAQALLATYGQDRETPLALGSIKSNIGHTQAAAGVAGVIKMVQALRHEELPATLHASTPSSHVDWNSGAVSLLTEPSPWPRTAAPRRAAVSSFGVSGTNAHVVLEQGDPEPAEASAGPDAIDDGVPGNAGTDDIAAAGAAPLVLSARSEQALRASAARLADALPDLAWTSAAYSLATTRARLPHRAVALTGEAVAALAAGRAHPMLVQGDGDTAHSAGRVAFVFPGQGSQWVGMALRLRDESPMFAARLAECEAALSEFVDWSLSDALADAELLERVDVVQPALWAVMVSLAEVWRSWGVEPAAVVGHSQGEIAAAVVAGALSLEDGARVVALRSRALRRLAGRGGMVSVALPEAEVRDRIAGWGERISVAAVNGASAVVVSGEPHALDELISACEAEDVRAKRVPVDYASHSPQVDELREELLDVLAPVTPRGAEVPVHSTLTGRIEHGPGMDAQYWFDNLRSTVRFSDAVEQLAAHGYATFVECSPHPVLTVAMPDEVTAIGSLRRDDGGAHRLLLSLGEAVVAGVEPDWNAVVPDGERVDLPTYAFQRKRYWLEPGPRDAGGDAEFWAAVARGDVDALAPEGPERDALRTALPALAHWHERRHERETIDSWRYRLDWELVTPAGRLGGDWRVLVHESQADHPWPRAAADALGAEIVTAADTDDRAALADALGGDGVLSFLALAEHPHATHPDLTAGVALTLTAVQALHDTGAATRFWAATTGAVTTGDDDPVRSPAQAQIWGLGKVAALEHPALWGGLVDLPETPDGVPRRTPADDLPPVLSGHEDQVAIREGGILAARLVRAATPRTDLWQPSGTVLLTGGTGALGPHVVRRLVAAGATKVVLTSRLGADAPGAAELTAECAGVVEFVRCDVTNADDVRALADRLAADGTPVRTVLHAAAFIKLGPVAGTTLDEVAAVVRPKVGGAAVLDDVFGDDLDDFVLFSSIAGVWGSGDHVAYAAANAHLDALAAARRGRGAAGTSIAWGVWAAANEWDDGHVHEGVDPERVHRQGLPFLDPDRALTAMVEVIGSEAVPVVADVAWDRFVPVFTSLRPSPLLSRVPEVVAIAERDTRSDADPSGTGLRAELAGLARGDRLRRLTALVREHAAATLGHGGADEVEARTAFRDLGLDSLTAVALRNRLTAATGLRVPTTVVFDHPTATALAEHLDGELFGHATGAEVVVREAVDEPLAVVGMACRFPGGVTGPDELWALLDEGGDAIGPLPTDRGWPADLYDPDADRPGTTYAEGGGFLDRVADFDPAFFGISPREAAAMDPHQRLLLEVSWEALERAGVDPTTLRGTRTGVFAGVNYQDYAARLGDTDDASQGHLLVGSAASVVSGRVSYTLGLQGPAVTVDTACSSSLVALHLAARSLRSGESDLALAGGVAVMSGPGALIGFARQRGLAADGRCKAFGADADGMSLAEGAGMVVVTRLSEARRRDWPVLAVVRGTATNQDGASNGLTAPNGPSQQRVIREALAEAGLGTSDVDYVEAHGTGTSLGDPIEADALLATYGQGRQRPLLLGSVKSNIGHTQAASGVAGLIKAVLALQHARLPRTLHVDVPTPHVDWTAGQVSLVQEATAWPDTGHERRAGVSSFGMSGTNAHVVLEQGDSVPVPVAPAESGTPGELGAAPVPLMVTGRTRTALRDHAARVAAVLPGLPAESVAFSLATTRTAFEYRAVAVGADAVRALAEGVPHPLLVEGSAGEPGRLV
ncbi:Acyl transferase domain-containing protein, partial [Prauserella aidingensis]|uniref:type I polyketide synthase n=1 Tax=Prauserella aidingensis TaxID=387890 RepID=UPI0020A4760F